MLKHLDRSDCQGLATYLWDQGARRVTVELHAFNPHSKAKIKMVHRDYESELICSRDMCFNLQP